MKLLEKIFSNLQENPSAPWIHEVHGNHVHTCTKAEFSDLIHKARQSLAEFGIRKGDRVVLLGPNSTQWIACDLAIISMGAITVPLYNRQEPAELAFMSGDCQPALFIHATDDLKKDVLKHWTSACQTALLADMFKPISQPQTDATNDAAKTATIIYTSGTSGNPKGVMLTGNNVDFMIERTTNQLYQAKGNQKTNDRVFHFLPLCFAGSRMMLWTQLYRNNPVYLSTDLKNLVQEMQTAAPEFYLNVPAILERIRSGVEAKIHEKGGIVLWLYQHPMLSKLILPSIRKKIGKNLRFLICGSAALHPNTQKWFNTLGIKILQVYGLTETTAIITMDEPGHVQTGFVGTPIDGVEIKLSAEGELLTKGPNLFEGYWNRGKEFDECFVDGWFKTGDLAEVSATGNVRISGRIKNVIIPTSGHNIVPEPIEELLQKNCTKINHAVLIGHGKPYLSIIVTGDVSNNEIEKAISEINQHVPHYRKIKTYLHHKDGFTVENGLLTANQKIKRRAVETTLQPQIEKMYTQVQL